MEIRKETMCKNEEGKILLFDVSRYGGILKEVPENEVPKRHRIAIEDLHGAGVISGDYERSNTSGVTWGKYFKKVSDKIKFIPKFYYDELKDIKKIEVENSIKYFNKYSENSNVPINFSISDDITYITVRLGMDIKGENLIPVESEYSQYSEYFRKYYTYNLVLISYLKYSEEEAERIKELFNVDSLNTSFKININDLKDYINKFKKIEEIWRFRLVEDFFE